MAMYSRRVDSKPLMRVAYRGGAGTFGVTVPPGYDWEVTRVELVNPGPGVCSCDVNVGASGPFGLLTAVRGTALTTMQTVVSTAFIALAAGDEIVAFCYNGTYMNVLVDGLARQRL